MPFSDAQIAASKSNGSCSKGPLGPETRAISARNSTKHGLTGAGKVVSEADRREIDLRIVELTADMKPRSPAGVMLIARMATLSLRAEMAALQESAAIARNVRNAADAFDEERIDRANALFGGLEADPRDGLRKLRKMPEGVGLLIEAWHDLLNALGGAEDTDWTAEHMTRAAALTGNKPDRARGSRVGALSRAYWGDFARLLPHEGGGLGEEARKRWAKAALFERIEAEIAALEAHFQTLDFETIELDRAEAGQRALFDASKPAILARRYAAEADRGFFKALKEFRQVEAESEARAEAPPTRPEPPPASRSGSFRETPPSPGYTSVSDESNDVMAEFFAAMEAKGRASRPAPTRLSPG